MRRAGACNQNRAYNKISICYSLFNIIGIGCKGFCFAAEDVIQIPQSSNITVYNHHICAQPQRHLCTICSNYAATDNDYLPLFNTTHAAKEYPPSAMCLHK